MSEEREMTLKEWCGRLPESHKVNRELQQLEQQLEGCMENSLITCPYCFEQFESSGRIVELEQQLAASQEAIDIKNEQLDELEQQLSEAQTSRNKWKRAARFKEEMLLENKRLREAAIDFIDQMRVQGLEGNLLPAEYDTLVDVVKNYRVDIDET